MPIRQLELFLPRPLSYDADLGTLQCGRRRCGNVVCKVSFMDRATTGARGVIPDLCVH